MNLFGTKRSSKIEKMNLQQNDNLHYVPNSTNGLYLKFGRELYMTPNTNKMISPQLSSPPTLCRKRKGTSSYCPLQNRQLSSELLLPKLDDHNGGDGGKPFKFYPITRSSHPFWLEIKENINQQTSLSSNCKTYGNSLEILRSIPNLEKEGNRMSRKRPNIDTTFPKPKQRKRSFSPTGVYSLKI